MSERFIYLIKNREVALTEGAIIERIRRSDARLLNLHLLHTPLIYNGNGRQLLSGLHEQYLEIGRQYNLPLLTFTDTWRASGERLKEAGFSGMDANGDAVRFLRNIIQGYGDYADKVYVGGLIGCAGDAYNPVESLSADEASSFHAFQVHQLASAGVDFLFAATIPSVSEATGIACTMSQTGVPYAISFVLDRIGLILDGTSVRNAMKAIDAAVSPSPLFYMANCCHPTFYEAVMRVLLREDKSLLNRMIGLQANTSSKSASELDNMKYLDSEDPAAFAESMTALHRDFGTKILGGCCGTDERHIAAIAQKLQNKSAKWNSHE